MFFREQAFTLVELIVVVTILAILSTIGFVSYSSYLSGVRDTNRISSLGAISDGLEIYKTKNTLPTPDDYIEIKANGTIIGHQGYVGKNVLETIDYSKNGKDPKDAIYYSYYLTKDKKYYQLLAFLEEENNLETNLNLTNNTYAIDYTTRYPKVVGNKLGILTESGTNIPIQEIGITELDIATTTDNYIANFTDKIMLEGDNIKLQPLEYVLSTGGPTLSCRELLNKKSSLKNNNGYYLILTGNYIEKTYCDMTTDGGGWTLISSYINGSFFDVCNTVYGTNCRTSCQEFSNDGESCNDSGEYAIQDSELQILRDKYIINDSYGDVENYTTNDYVGKSYYNTSFSEMMFINDEGEYITYNMSDTSNSSMKDYYNSIKSDEMLEHRFESYKTNITDISSVNNLNTLSIAMHEGDNDGGFSIDYGARKYMKWSPAYGGPTWDAKNNGSYHFDDGMGAWRHRKLGGSLNNESVYISWFVR